MCVCTRAFVGMYVCVLMVCGCAGVCTRAFVGTYVLFVCAPVVLCVLLCVGECYCVHVFVGVCVGEGGDVWVCRCARAVVITLLRSWGCLEMSLHSGRRLCAAVCRL